MVPDFFAGVMIEAKMAAGHIRQIGEDVLIRYRNLPVLHILGVDKLNGTQKAQFFQKDGADESVKIAAG